MKKSFLVVLLFVVSVSFSFANQPEPKEVQAATLHKEVYKKVKYPAVASENKIEGEVWVSFYVDRNGKIEVKEASSLEESLKTGVLKQLKKLKLSKNYYDSKELFLMKFKFELV